MKPPSESGFPVRRRVLIIGGAGFIGTNLAHRLLSGGNAVIIFDNLSRPGVERNLAWLRTQHPARLNVVVGDVRDENALAGPVRQAGQVFHFAGYGSAATSIVDPVTDFEVNVRGTLNVLESIRRLDRRVPLLFTSRYAAPVESCNGSNAPVTDDPDVLACYSPHRCSNAAAEQYVLSYARAFGIPATVLRLSTIYGPHQCEDEQDGWVVDSVLRALQSRPIAVEGDGRWTRDVLFVEDLVDAMIFAQANVDAVRGQAFNLGGGAATAISATDLIASIAEIQGEVPTILRTDAMRAHGRAVVADSGHFSAATGWNPRVGVYEGIRRLYRWLLEHRVAEADAEHVAPPTAVLAAGHDIELMAKAH